MHVKETAPLQGSLRLVLEAMVMILFCSPVFSGFDPGMTGVDYDRTVCQARLADI